MIDQESAVKRKRWPVFGLEKVTGKGKMGQMYKMGQMHMRLYERKAPGGEHLVF